MAADSVAPSASAGPRRPPPWIPDPARYDPGRNSLDRSFLRLRDAGTQPSQTEALLFVGLLSGDVRSSEEGSGVEEVGVRRFEGGGGRWEACPQSREPGTKPFAELFVLTFQGRGFRK